MVSPDKDGRFDGEIQPLIARLAYQQFDRDPDFPASRPDAIYLPKWLRGHDHTGPIFKDFEWDQPLAPPIDQEVVQAPLPGNRYDLTDLRCSVNFFVSEMQHFVVAMDADVVLYSRALENEYPVDFVSSDRPPYAQLKDPPWLKFLDIAGLSSYRQFCSALDLKELVGHRERVAIQCMPQYARQGVNSWYSPRKVGDQMNDKMVQRLAHNILSYRVAAWIAAECRKSVLPALQEFKATVADRDREMVANPVSGFSKVDLDSKSLATERKPSVVSKSISNAYRSFEYACRQSGGHLSDRDAYNYLEENGVDESDPHCGDLESYELPSIETWGRYLRDGRRAYGTQKNRRRLTSTGSRSVIRQDQI